MNIKLFRISGMLGNHGVWEAQTLNPNQKLCELQKSKASGRWLDALALRHAATKP